MTQKTSWPSPAQAWQLVAVLSFAYILSYLDRIVINLLVGPIQEAFEINDTQFGALQGVAFGIFYTALAIPIGRLADSGPRRRIVAIGVSVFGFFSMMSGFAPNYAFLFFTRVGVGAGEASVAPTAYSMIADSFPPERLGRALAVFTMSAFVGVGAAYLMGGALIAWLQSFGDLTIGPFREVAPWRLTFVLAGAPAVLVALLIFTCVEPKRHSTATTTPAFSAVINAFYERRATFIWMFAGFAVITFSAYASSVWSPAFLFRTYDMTPAKVGLALGAIYLVCAPAGAYAGGWLSDRLTAKGVLDAPLRTAAIGYIGAGVFGGLAPLAPNAALAIAGLAVATIFSSLPYPLAATAIQLVTPGRMRGQISALYMTVINLVGLGLGPLIAGAMTDFIFTGADGIRYSLVVINALSAPLAFIFLWRALPHYRALRSNNEAS